MQERPVNRSQIMVMVKQMCGDKQFNSSSGWYCNFVRRNPDIKHLIAKKTKDSPDDVISLPDEDQN